MATLVSTITDIIHKTFTPIFYPGYIEQEERLDEFENSLSELERGVTIHQVDSDERLFKSNGEDPPTTLKELFFGWFTKSKEQSEYNN